MDGLDLFALLVLITLVLTALAAAYILGGLPGKIALKRGHPQADAIRACGWLGLATLGILWPIALIWAYLKPASPNSAKGDIS
jgi:Protein of unknown function (DUF3302)